jgi:hypothetical protein
MDRLRDYLRYPRWRANDAVWILAGVDPERTMGGPGDWGFVWLPGGLRDSWQNADGSVDRFTLERHVEMELEEVRGFVRGESRFPNEWVTHALKLGYPPPWLDSARSDPECARYLKLSPPAAGGKGKAKRSPQGMAKVEVVRAWDKWKRGEAFYDDNASFIDAMDYKYFEPKIVGRTGPAVEGHRTIAGWVRDLDLEFKTGKTKDWIREARG